MDLVRVESQEVNRLFEIVKNTGAIMVSKSGAPLNDIVSTFLAAPTSRVSALQYTLSLSKGRVLEVRKD